MSALGLAVPKRESLRGGSGSRTPAFLLDSRSVVGDASQNRSTPIEAIVIDDRAEDEEDDEYEDDDEEEEEPPDRRGDARDLRVTAASEPSVAPLAPASTTLVEMPSVQSASQEQSGRHSSVGLRRVPKTLQRVLLGNPGEPPPLKASDVKVASREVLVEAFQEIDLSYNGFIDLDELVEALQLCGLSATLEATQRILEELDTNMDGRIDVEEFIDFVRHMEDMQRYALQRQGQGHFLSLCKYFCFLLNTVFLFGMVLIYTRAKDDMSSEIKGLAHSSLWISVALMIFLLITIVFYPILNLVVKNTLIKMWRAFWKKRPEPPLPNFGDTTVKQYDAAAYADVQQQMNGMLDRRSWSPMEVRETELTVDQKRLLQAGAMLPGAIPATEAAMQELQTNTLPVLDTGYNVGKRTIMQALEDNKAWR